MLEKHKEVRELEQNKKTREDLLEMALGQMWLLAEWNECNIKDEPEQVRANVSVITTSVALIINELRKTDSNTPKINRQR